MTRGPQSGFPVATLRSIQLWLTITALALAPLFFGSVDLFWVAVWTILLSIGAIGVLSVSFGAGQNRILLAFLSICCIYALIAVIQFSPHAVDRLNDPIWQRVETLLGGDVLPRIASRAQIPPLAAGHALLFAIAFLNGFCIGTSRRLSRTLFQFARYSILFYAIYGLAAFALTPDLLLWTPKTAYRGSLTATFVNHNSAATFVGMGAILWLCSAISEAQLARFSSIRMLLLSQSNETLAFSVILRSGCALACFFALLETGSRGGLICSCVGLLIAALLLLANTWKLRLWHLAALALPAFALAFAMLSRMGRIASQGLLDDGRWSVYKLSLQAIKQRPVLGSGLGTFPDVFPAFRTSALPSWGVWDYAHSTGLEIAVEMGAPMAAIVVMGAFSSIFILLHAAITCEASDRQMLAAIAGIAVLGYLHSLIDFSLQIPGFFIVFAILLGCGLARASCNREVAKSDNSREGH
jgi:hypothetical protein